jgi:hypothetical protein
MKKDNFEPEPKYVSPCDDCMHAMGIYRNETVCSKCRHNGKARPYYSSETFEPPNYNSTRQMEKMKVLKGAD